MSKTKILNFCQRATEFSLCLVVFSIPVSIAITNIGIGLCFIFWLIRKILNKDWRLANTPINIFLFLLILASLSSMFNSTKISSSITGMHKLFKGIILFFIYVETINDSKKLGKIIWSALFGLILVSLDGVYQYFRGVDFIRGFPIGTGLQYLDQNSGARIKASMHNPNDFGSYLITVVPILLSLVLFHLKGLKRWVLVLAGFMSLFCMFFTFQRIVGVAFLIIMILFSAIKKDKKPLIILSALILVSAYFLPKTILQWSVHHLNPYDFFIEAGGRRWHWQAAMNMIRAHPIIGIGVNTFSASYDKYKISTDPLSGFYAHNTYLQLTAEIGLIGLAVFIAMIISAVRGWWLNYRKINAAGLQAISLGVFAGFVGYLVSGILESNFQYSNLTVLFWVMMGLMAAISRISTEA